MKHPPASIAAITVFALCYALFVIFPQHRSMTACGGAIFLVFTGALTWRKALTECIQWNVVALFFWHLGAGRDIHAVPHAGGYRRVAG